MKLFSVFVAILALAGPIARAYPPSYDISSTAAAQDEARARKLPLAYLGIIPGVLTEASPQPNSDADLSQLALNTLQGRAVVITFDGRNMAPVPGLIHMQFHQPDDGPLQGGAAWLVPKIVFSDPGITKTLGRAGVRAGSALSQIFMAGGPSCAIMAEVRGSDEGVPPVGVAFLSLSWSLVAMKLAVSAAC